MVDYFKEHDADFNKHAQDPFMYRADYAFARHNDEIQELRYIF